MRLSESGFGRGDAAGLAMTLVRTFGSGAVALVDAQVTESADDADLQARWCEVRDALAVLGEANMHMAAALDLLDQIEEPSVPPILNDAIERLGLRHGEREAIGSSATVETCGSAFFEGKVRHHRMQARNCTNPDEKAVHLDAASRYATLRKRISDPQNTR